MKLTDPISPPSRKGPSRLTGARLRLIRPDEPVRVDAQAARDALTHERMTQRQAVRGTQARVLEDPADPRWVLAIRTAERLEGPVLTADRRARLVRLGEVMGLSVFDANLVIASVQDQARRGFHGPLAAEMAQPLLLTIAPRATPRGAARAMPWRTALLVALILALELALIAWALQ